MVKGDSSHFLDTRDGRRLSWACGRLVGEPLLIHHYTLTQFSRSFSLFLSLSVSPARLQVVNIAQ